MIRNRSVNGAKDLIPASATVHQQMRRRGALRTATILTLPTVALVVSAVLGWPVVRAGFETTKVPVNVKGGKIEPTWSEALPELPPPDRLRPLTPQEAHTANDERPILKQRVEAATAFRIGGEPQSKLRAIDCLTQAVYYEAASEGFAGGQAVAQVVLNRVRHRGFPNTVCGTVYQGSDRTTGCQFTFACDGSLARIVLPVLWARSRKIAGNALAGRVFAAIGQSTHYHADYVLPYWADSLDKVAVIGRHIFYRLRGLSGSRGAFGQPYAGAEPPPQPILAIDTRKSLDASQVRSIDIPDLPPPRVAEDTIAALAVGQIAGVRINQPLAADLDQGQLIVGDLVPVSKSKRKVSIEPEAKGVERLKPLEADDLRATPHRVGR